MKHKFIIFVSIVLVAEAQYETFPTSEYEIIQKIESAIIKANKI